MVHRKLNAGDSKFSSASEAPSLPAPVILSDRDATWFARFRRMPVAFGWIVVLGVGLLIELAGSYLVAWAQTRLETPVDNHLSPAEVQAGWQLLFDGQTTRGWQQTNGQEVSLDHVQDGCLNPHPCDYMLVSAERYADFQLSLDFKISPRCNSGVFVRTWPLVPRAGKDIGYNGIEIAVDDTTTAGYHDTGAIYDLVAPRKNAMRSSGHWNRLLITCDRGEITVSLNGELVSRMALDEWTQPNRRPDGSEHKFDISYRDHPRDGHLGLQDHGSDCWYKNIKLRRL